MMTAPGGLEDVRSSRTRKHIEAVIRATAYLGSTSPSQSSLTPPSHYNLEAQERMFGGSEAAPGGGASLPTRSIFDLIPAAEPPWQDRQEEDDEAEEDEDDVKRWHHGREGVHPSYHLQDGPKLWLSPQTADCYLVVPQRTDSSTSTAQEDSQIQAPAFPPSSREAAEVSPMSIANLVQKSGSGSSSSPTANLAKRPREEDHEQQRDEPMSKKLSTPTEGVAGAYTDGHSLEPPSSSSEPSAPSSDTPRRHTDAVQDAVRIYRVHKSIIVSQSALLQELLCPTDSSSLSSAPQRGRPFRRAGPPYDLSARANALAAAVSGRALSDANSASGPSLPLLMLLDSSTNGSYYSSSSSSPSSSALWPLSAVRRPSPPARCASLQQQQSSSSSSSSPATPTPTAAPRETLTSGNRPSRRFSHLPLPSILQSTPSSTALAAAAAETLDDDNSSKDPPSAKSSSTEILFPTTTSHPEPLLEKNKKDPTTTTTTSSSSSSSSPMMMKTNTKTNTKTKISIHLPLPDAPSFPLLLHYLYHHDLAALSSAIDALHVGDHDGDHNDDHNDDDDDDRDHGQSQKNDSKIGTGAGTGTGSDEEQRREVHLTERNKVTSKEPRSSSHRNRNRNAFEGREGQRQRERHVDHHKHHHHHHHHQQQQQQQQQRLLLVGGLIANLDHLGITERASRDWLAREWKRLKLSQTQTLLEIGMQRNPNPNANGNGRG